MAAAESHIPVERIASCVYLIRGRSVMLDSDLAELYGIPTGRLNEQVKRNAGRFPLDFAFQLTDSERESLLSQFAISNVGRGGRRTPPWAFTEHGVAMLSSVLHSETAIQVNIAIVRTFVHMRRLLASNAELARKVARHDQQIAVLFDHVGRLLTPPEPSPKHSIGYVPTDDDD